MTADSKIHLAPDFYLQDLSRLDHFIDQLQSSAKEYPLKMISRRLVRSHNTWTQNSWRLVKGKDPCTVQINSEDAKAMNLESGQLIKVTSKTGEVELPVEVTDDMVKGVVSIPQGWGHRYSDIEMSNAAKQPGVSINDLTDPGRIDELTGNAAFNGVPVRLSAVS